MIKNWLKSLALTVLSVTIGWITVDIISADIWILFIYISTILIEILSLMFIIKTKSKIYKKIICGLLLPSNYYLLFVLLMTYTLFFRDWTFNL
jgi:hypothetical protein